MPNLNWGLLIATKDRLEALKKCVQLALAQTRMPTEIIVIDASADWEAHAQEIGSIVAEYPKVRFVYDKGVMPSLSVQRNQAIDYAQADICFMIDDDSFLYPNCAERIMEIYEADTGGCVAGVQTAQSEVMPNMQIKDNSRNDIINVGGLMHRPGWKRWVLRNILLVGKQQFFIPYDDMFPDQPLPESVKHLEVTTSSLFDGFRMTYRREVIAATRFDPLLRYYCPGEDLDASYRVSRQGALLTARQALVYHHTSATGRMNRYQVKLLTWLNQAMLLHCHSTDPRRGRRRYNGLMARRIFAELIKDCAAGRLGAPQTRATITAWRLSRRIFRLSLKELEKLYPELQGNIVRGKMAWP